MARRFGQDDEDKWGEDTGNPVVKFILQRSWVLIVPFIAMGWYQAREVSPRIKAIEARMAAERDSVDAQRASILTGARKIEANLSAIRALSDTFQVRFDAVETLIDSVTILRNADLSDLRFLENQADSLRRTLSLATGKSTELSALLPPMQARIESLRTVIQARSEEIARLEEEKRADADLTDRVLRPDAYRKNSALFTGEGDYPNRDALPER